MKSDRRLAGLVLVLLMVLSAGATGAAERRVVWFDQGHGQMFHIDQEGPLQLSSLAALLAGKGAQVETGRQQLDDKLLGGVRALVISGAFQPLTAEEIAAVQRFVAAGGKLVVLLHIAPPAVALLAGFDVDSSTGVIREARQILEGDPLNFLATELGSHPLLEGVPGVAVYGAWALRGRTPEVQVLARTGPDAWMDLNGNRSFDAQDARQAFAVLLAGRKGRGEFLMFGDDAVFQNRFIGSNRRLAENLADWLLQPPPGD